MNPLEAPPGVRITLDHIGIATRDLEESLGHLGVLFPAPPTPVEEVEDQGVRLTFIDVGGPRLELLEPSREGGPIDRHLERRGSGIHHLSFRVEGIPIDDWFEHLRSRGVQLLGESPTKGSEGNRIFFVHPRSAGGLLIEYQQADD